MFNISTRETYRLRISLYSNASLLDEDEVIEIHRFCRAIEPLMKRFEAGYVNKLTFTDAGPEIEIVCFDVDYILKTIAPVMGCFSIMTEGFPSGSAPSAYYTTTSLNCRPANTIKDEVKVDLGKYLPSESDDGLTGEHTSTPISVN